MAGLGGLGVGFGEAQDSALLHIFESRIICLHAQPKPHARKGRTSHDGCSRVLLITGDSASVAVLLLPLSQL